MKWSFEKIFSAVKILFSLHCILSFSPPQPWPFTARADTPDLSSTYDAAEDWK